MKLTATLYLLAASLLLFSSCKKEDYPGPCENCIVIEPDTPQPIDTISTAVSAINIRGTEALISVASEGDYPSTPLEISISGENGYILYPETIGYNGLTLSKNWTYYDLKPGIYTVQIKQLNYVPGSNLPTFDIAAASPDGVNFGTNATMSQVNPDTNEVDHTLILRVVAP